MSKIKPYQKEFIDFLISSQALVFGDFTTKSGRKTPYFINTGCFADGNLISRLGRYYATHIVSNSLDQVDIVFGPAYKGVPLAVSTVISMARDYESILSYTFDRKEAKEHGDKGRFVGKVPENGDTIIIVEDVITAGTTLRQIVPRLRNLAEVDITGVVVAVDRCERGESGVAATQEIREHLGIEVFPITTIHQIVEYLCESSTESRTVSDQQLDNVKQYLKDFGS